MEEKKKKKKRYARKSEPPHDKTNKMACAPSEDSDQPGHPHSMIRVFAACMKKAWVLSYPLSGAHSHFVGFVMRRLKYPCGLKFRHSRLLFGIAKFFSPHFLFSLHVVLLVAVLKWNINICIFGK